MAELIVGRPLGLVRQNFVGFARLFKLVLGVFIFRVTVRMVLHRELSVRPFNFLLIRVPGNPENVVIIALGHALKPCFLNAENAELLRVFQLPDVRQIYFFSSSLTSSNSASTASSAVWD